MSRNREVGMFCFFTSLLLVFVGYGIWKKQRTDWIPNYKQKPGQNTAAYCTLVGKGVILAGIGLFLLSVPISLEQPDKMFAVCCLLACLVFIGTGIGYYIRAEKRYNS